MTDGEINTHFSAIENQALVEFLKNLRKKGLSLTHLILFGSKARGDFSPNSDIDILAITANPDAKKALYQEVAFILSQFDVYLSIKAFTEQEFKRLNQFKTPFTENIKKEGINLWPEL